MARRPAALFASRLKALFVPYTGYLLDDGRETIGTTPLDAEPEVILRMPGDSLLPVFLAAATTIIFVGLLGHWWILAGAGALGAFAVLCLWFSPTPPAEAQHARIYG